jgi:drug/metabolite transporter (DMT)-like permease
VDVDMSLDYGTTLLAALLIGTGFVLQQSVAEREPESRFLSLRLMADLLRTPRWLAGILAMIGGQVLAAWSIGHLTLSVVEPLLTTNLIWALVLAVPLSMRAQRVPPGPPAPGHAAPGSPPGRAAPASLPPGPAARGWPALGLGHGPAGAAKPARPRRAVRAWEVAGAAVLCVGVGLLSSARSAKPIGLSFGSFSHWPAAAAIAAIAFACVQLGRRRQGRSRALLTGIAAGLVFGIQDALTRQTLETLQSGGISALFTSWAPYALVGAGAVGIWLMQSAFNAGPLQLSLPAISAGEPLVGILLGIIVFGDRIQVVPLQLALQAGGIAALVAGVILVARAPALTHLRPHGAITLPHPSLPHPSLPHLNFSYRGPSDPDTSAADPDPAFPETPGLAGPEPNGVTRPHGVGGSAGGGAVGGAIGGSAIGGSPAPDTQALS